jgi:hypothetical protein
MNRPPRQRTLMAATWPIRREQEMTVTPLRPVRLAGFLLVALCILSSATTAKGPELAYGAPPPAAVGTSSSSVSDVQCPCNAGLPRASVVNASPAGCPCNAGLADAPSGALSASVASGNIVPAGAVRRVRVVHARSTQPRGTFDWAAASVGAGVTAGLGLLVVGGALLFSRRRVRGQLQAS